MELFEDAINRMARILKSSTMEMMQFKCLANKASQISIQNIKKEVDFNDAPDEFRGFIKLFIFKYFESISKYC